MSELGFLGLPLDFQGICKIYPPKINDIVADNNSYKYIKILTYSQEEIEDEYVENGLNLDELLTPFEYILNNAYNNEQFSKLLQNGLKFFIHEPVLIIPERKLIMIGDIKEIDSIQKLRLIQEKDYFAFQNGIRQVLGIDEIEPPIPNENPRIKAMKAKARYRDKIKHKQDGGLKLETLLASICCMNFGLNPLNIGELSYASVSTLLAIYQQKEKYELDIQSLLAGADSKKIKPVYWIKNLD